MVTSRPDGSARGSFVDQANAEAFQRLTAADPWLVDVRPARDVIPGYKDNLILTSGAPLTWADYTGGQREH